MQSFNREMIGGLINCILESFQINHLLSKSIRQYYN